MKSKDNKKINDKIISEIFFNSLENLKYPEFPYKIRKSDEIKKILQDDYNPYGEESVIKYSTGSSILFFTKMINNYSIDMNDKYLTTKSFEYLTKNSIHLIETVGRNLDFSDNFSHFTYILCKLVGKNKAMKIIRKYRKYERVNRTIDWRVWVSKGLIKAVMEDNIKGMSDKKFEKISTNKFLYYMKVFGYSRFKKILDICESRGMPLHDIMVNLPYVVNRKYYDNKGYVLESYKDEVLKLFENNDKVSLDKLSKLLQFINYKVIRENKLPNWTEKNRYISLVCFAKESKNNKFLRNTVIRKGELAGIKDKELYEHEIHFSDDVIDIINIGSQTGCCFKPDGMAKSLVKACLTSDIAAILKGRISNKPWFSFIWEMGVVEEGLLKTHLVMDNVEMMGGVISEESFNKHIIKYLIENTSYEKVYVGSRYNDVERSTFPTSTTKRPHRLIGHSRNFKDYSTYDDSSELHTILDRSFPEDNEYNLEVKKLESRADKQRAMYLVVAECKEHEDSINVRKIDEWEVIVNSDESNMIFDTKNFCIRLYDENGEILKEYRRKNKRDIEAYNNIAELLGEEKIELKPEADITDEKVVESNVFQQ